MDKKTLKFTIADDKIAELFGIQNFTNKETAVFEVLKNSYDAGANKFNLKIEKDAIVFSDDGKGMDYATLETAWMSVGSSEKEYSFVDFNGNNRVYSGSKGIGRFALARLGSNIEVISKAEKSKCASWSTDWNTTTLDYHEEIPASLSLLNRGTEITVSSLRDNWSELGVRRLSSYLSKCMNTDLMKVCICGFGFESNVTKVFNSPKKGENFLSAIHLNYDASSMMLNVKIDSDEFLDDVIQLLPKNISIYSFEKSIDMLAELKGSKDIDVDYNDYSQFLKDVGSFSANLYFNLKPSPLDIERFHYKHKKSLSSQAEGIILFRNAFTIAGFDGSKDWLELGKRSRKSPAAASHPTGAWRIRENQITGEVLIDKARNPFLIDMQNRQGLEENTHYSFFKEIIDNGIAVFERYRQGIIRSISTDNDRKETTSRINTRVIESFLYKPLDIKTHEDKRIENLRDAIKGMYDESKVLKREIDAKDTKYEYDVRILNLLSTIGLKASFTAHEMQHDRNFINSYKKHMTDAFIHYGFWEIIDNSKNQQLPHLNIYEMLERNEKVSKKTLVFMDNMLATISKENFMPSDLDIVELMKKICQNWETDYSWLRIELSVPEILIFRTSIDILDVIFDNLLLNSVQQNKDNGQLRISINISKESNHIMFQYSDDGVGLDDKYKDDPFRILDVHETSRRDGHGLGMWIVNNTIKNTGGKITSIVGPKNQGFKISFSIGDSL